MTGSFQSRFVYFLRPPGEAGPVKIGCSDRPESRLKAYRTWSPFPLEIAATCDGDFDLERRLHSVFADDHIHGEWFRSSERLTALIDKVRGGTFRASDVPAATARPHGLKRVVPLEVRERTGLTIAVHHRIYKWGITPPLTVLTALAGLQGLAGPERNEAVALVRAYLAGDPLIGGQPTTSSHGWPRFVRYCVRRGLNPHDYTDHRSEAA